MHLSQGVKDANTPTVNTHSHTHTRTHKKPLVVKKIQPEFITHRKRDGVKERRVSGGWFPQRPSN